MQLYTAVVQPRQMCANHHVIEQIQALLHRRVPQRPTSEFLYTLSTQTRSPFLPLWITLTVFQRCPRRGLHHLTVATAEASCNIRAFATVTDTSTCRQLHIVSWLVPRQPASCAECNSAINNECREMVCSLADCLRTATLTKVLPVAVGAFVQSHSKHAVMCDCGFWT